MSYNVGNYIDCPNLQENLNSQFGGLNANVREPSPLTEFLVSPQNTAGALQRQIDTGNGHKRIVEVVYETRFDEGDVSSSAVLDCTAGNKPGETSKTYEIDETVGSSYKWSLKLTDLISRCEDDAPYFARQVQKAIDVLVRAINKKNWDKAATLFGNFATTGTKAKINIATKLSSGAYSPDAIEKVSFEYMRMLYNGSIAIFGGSQDFWNYFNSMAAACCNTAVGIDLGQYFGQKPVVPFFDRRAETALGTGEILAMAPGALQMLTYNEFVGPKGIRVLSQDTAHYGVITDPATGIMFDYKAEFSCGQWNFQLKLAHDLVGLPTDMFSTSDFMKAVTWVNHFDIVNP